MTSLTANLAASPGTPLPLLEALARTALHDPSYHRETIIALGANPAVPAELLEEIAADRDAATRCAVLRNPATTAGDARRWLAQWTRPAPQMLVWRTALRHVPDPDGALATAALDRHGSARWLLGEILDSTTTCDAARLRAATALAGYTGKLPSTDRQRILGVARRDASTLEVLLAHARSAELRPSLLNLRTLHRRGGDPTVRRQNVLELAAWMARTDDEALVLAVLATDQRAGAWRAAAHALRPGWDALATAVLDDTRTRVPHQPAAARAAALALLGNPAAPQPVRLAAGTLLAADPTPIGREALEDLQRAMTSPGERTAVATVTRSTTLLRWFAVRCPDLPTGAATHLAHTLATAPAQGVDLTAAANALLARGDLPPEHRDALLRSIDIPTGFGLAQVTALPWHDEVALVAALNEARVSRSQCLPLLWHHVGASRATDPRPGLGERGCLPAAILTFGAEHLPVTTGHVGHLAADVLHDAGMSPHAAAALQVLATLLRQGFPGSLAELATVTRAATA